MSEQRGDHRAGGGVAVVPSGHMVSPVPDLFNDTRMQLVRNQLAKDAPEDVFLAMVEIARTRGLDPLARQIGVIKFGGQWQVMTTIDGYRALAEKTGHYAGSDEPVFTMSGQRIGNKQTGITRPDSASVTVYKLLNGHRYPFTATVYWEEYAGQNVWLTKPRTMLAKVAESHALRKAFPSVLSGMYVDGEMDQLAIEASGTVREASPGAIETSATINEQPSAPVDFIEPDRKRANDAMHAAGDALGMDHQYIRRFIAERSGKPESELSSMTDWDARQFRWAKLQIDRFGRDWVQAQEAEPVDTEPVDAEVIETGMAGGVRRTLRAGELVDRETGEIVPAEDADDAIVFPTTPASLLPSEDLPPVRRNYDHLAN